MHILSFAAFQWHITQSCCFFSGSVMYSCSLIFPQSLLFGSSGLVWDILVLFCPKCVGESMSEKVLDQVNVLIFSAFDLPASASIHSTRYCFWESMPPSHDATTSELTQITSICIALVGGNMQSAGLKDQPLSF